MWCWRKSPKEDRLGVCMAGSDLLFQEQHFYGKGVDRSALKDMENIILVTHHFSWEVLQKKKKKKQKAYVCCFLNIRKIGLLSWCSPLVFQPHFTFLESVNSLQPEEYKVIIINRHFPLCFSVGIWWSLTEGLIFDKYHCSRSFYLPSYQFPFSYGLDPTSSLWKSLLIQKRERLIILLKNNNKPPFSSAQENTYKIWVSFHILSIKPKKVMTKQ